MKVDERACETVLKLDGCYEPVCLLIAAPHRAEAMDSHRGRRRPSSCDAVSRDHGFRKARIPE